MNKARFELRFNRIRVIYLTPPHGPTMSHHYFDSTFVSGVRMMRNQTGKDLPPVHVTFIYPHPESTAEYDRIFRCLVVFGQKDNSMMLDSSIANKPIVMANDEPLAYFEQYAQQFINKFEHPKETARHTPRIILEKLEDENLSVEKVARRMAVSTRTLQLRLAAEGMVFSDL